MDMGKLILLLVVMQVIGTIIHKRAQKKKQAEEIDEIEMERAPDAAPSIKRRKPFVSDSDGDVHNEHSPTYRRVPEYEIEESQRGDRDNTRKSLKHEVRKHHDAAVSTQTQDPKSASRQSSVPGKSTSQQAKSAASRVGKDLLEQLAKELGLPPSTVPGSSRPQQRSPESRPSENSEDDPRSSREQYGNGNVTYRKQDGNLRVSKPTNRPASKTKEGAEDWEARRESRRQLDHLAAQPLEAATTPITTHSGLKLLDRLNAVQAIELQAIFGQAPGLRNWESRLAAGQKQRVAQQTPPT